MNETIQQVARDAIQLHKELDELSDKLEEKKEQLRELADGDKLQVVVENFGKVEVTLPRAGSQKVEININEDVLDKIPAIRQKLVDAGVAKETIIIDKDKLFKAIELKRKLIEKGIITETVKTVSAAKASVKIKHNV